MVLGREVAELPEAVRQHLVERMRDRAISLSDLKELRLWMETWSEAKLLKVRPSDGNWRNAL
jgi:hypothetical protein